MSVNDVDRMLSRMKPSSPGADAKNLKALSKVNRLLKYADDTTLLVPSNPDFDLKDEFENVKQWAKDNNDS